MLKKIRQAVVGIQRWNREVVMLANVLTHGCHVWTTYVQTVGLSALRVLEKIDGVN